MKDQEARKMVSSLSAKYVEKYAEPEAAPAKEKAGVLKYVAMAACLMLLIGLAAGNIALAGGEKKSKQYKDGNGYKVETIDLLGIKKEDIINAPLYVMTVTGGEKFEAAAAFIEELREDWYLVHAGELQEWPNPYEGFDFSYAIPIFRFTGMDEHNTEYYFLSIEEGRIIRVAEMAMDSETGEFLRCLIVSGEYPALADNEEDDRGPGFSNLMKWFAHLTTEDNPVMLAHIDSVDEKIAGQFLVTGDMAYCPVNSFMGYPSAFQNYTPEIDWQRVKDYGWELEVKKIDLY